MDLMERVRRSCEDALINSLTGKQHLSRRIEIDMGEQFNRFNEEIDKLKDRLSHHEKDVNTPINSTKSSIPSLSLNNNNSTDNINRSLNSSHSSHQPINIPTSVIERRTPSIKRKLDNTSSSYIKNKKQKINGLKRKINSSSNNFEDGLKITTIKNIKRKLDNTSDSFEDDTFIEKDGKRLKIVRKKNKIPKFSGEINKNKMNLGRRLSVQDIKNKTSDVTSKSEDVDEYSQWK
jgi:exonuclease VII large subunit